MHINNIVGFLLISPVSLWSACQACNAYTHTASYSSFLQKKLFFFTIPTTVISSVPSKWPLLAWT